MKILKKMSYFLIFVFYFASCFIMFFAEYPTVSGSSTLPRFFVAGVILALILLIIVPRSLRQLIVQECTRPPDIPLWKSPAAKKYYSAFAISIIFSGYLLFVGLWFSTLLSYLNQHNAIAPIQQVKARITSKEFKHRRIKIWIVHYHIFNATRRINGKDLYDELEPGDEITFTVQKGRFGEYFALELIIEKNQYHYDLRGRV